MFHFSTLCCVNHCAVQVSCTFNLSMPSPHLYSMYIKLRPHRLCRNKAKAVWEQGHIDCKSCAGTRLHWLQKLCGNKATLTAKAVWEQGHIDYKSCAGTRLHRLQKLCGNKATSTVREQGHIDCKSCAGTRPHRLQSCVETRPHRLQKLCGNKAISTAKAVREQRVYRLQSYAGLINRYSATIWCHYSNY